MSTSLEECLSFVEVSALDWTNLCWLKPWTWPENSELSEHRHRRTICWRSLKHIEDIKTPRMSMLCSEIRPWLAQGRPRAAMAQQTSWGTTRSGGSPCLPRLIPNISKHGWVQSESVKFHQVSKVSGVQWFSYAIWQCTIVNTSGSSINPSFFVFLEVSWFLQRDQTGQGVPTADYPDHLVYIQGGWSRQQCSGGCSASFPTLGVAALRGLPPPWRVIIFSLRQVNNIGYQ